MSNDSTVWNILPENSTAIPSVAQEQQDGHELLLVILSVLLVGSLISLAVFLLACRRCWPGGKCYARASDDPEKTNCHYAEESRPTHEITIRVDESDCLSMASCHNQETERFLSTGTMGRRVSFNEAALFDHGKKAQEKGRRYTLTEGDFHHLKNARLTHLHVAPPGLKIVTIQECDSAENTVAMTMRPAAKSALSIFQPMLCPLPQTALTGPRANPSCALPGDALNSVLDAGFGEDAAALRARQPTSSPIEMMGAGPRGRGSSGSVGEGAAVRSGAAGSQGPVLQFFTTLRRHASLEGASPYFKIKKWKLDSSQRASSLDTRGSPKRRQFQRQRAASESMDQDDNDAHHIDLLQYFARTQEDAYGPANPKARLLSPPPTPPPSLGRVEVEVTVEPSCGRGGPGVIGLSPDPQDDAPSPSRREGADVPDPQNSQSLYKDIWTLRATLERYAASDLSGGNNDRNSVCSDAESVCSQGGRRQAERGELPSHPSQDLGDESEGGEDARDVSADERLAETETRKSKRDSTEYERGGGDAETGNRKLLQMDSGYASIEVPSRGAEDLRLFRGGSPKDRTANEKRHHFTNAGRTGTVGESFESRLSEEEPEDELLPAASGGVSVETAAGPPSRVPAPQPPALHRRDYSIDEKTDALFREFLRHDPQFDQQESPLRKHRSRVHLRKQWQRHKQWSDPGVRHFQSSFDRLRAPLRRGDSVNCPLDTSYHSTLPRIVSAPDEEASEAPGVEPTDDEDAASPAHPPPRRSPCGERLEPRESYGPHTITAELSDKLAATLDDRLYAGLRRATGVAEAPATAGEYVAVAVAVAHASPDHSPV